MNVYAPRGGDSPFGETGAIMLLLAGAIRLDYRAEALRTDSPAKALEPTE
jgi:hypothetical protein